MLKCRQARGRCFVLTDVGRFYRGATRPAPVRRRPACDSAREEGEVGQHLLCFTHGRDGNSDAFFKYCELQREAAVLLRIAHPAISLTRPDLGTCGLRPREACRMPHVEVSGLRKASEALSAVPFSQLNFPSMVTRLMPFPCQAARSGFPGLAGLPPFLFLWTPPLRFRGVTGRGANHAFVSSTT